MGEACTPLGYLRGISPVPLMLMVKIESYAIGSAFGRGQSFGCSQSVQICNSPAIDVLGWLRKIYFFYKTQCVPHITRVNVPIVVQFVVVPMCFYGFKVSEGHFLNILTHSNCNMFYLRNHNHFYHEIHQIYEKIQMLVTASLYLWWWYGSYSRLIVFL